MKIYDILNICTSIKKEKKITYCNYYNKYNNSNIEFDVIQDMGTIIWGLQEEFVYRIYFMSNNFYTLSNCLKRVPKGAVTDLICKGEIGQLGEIIKKSGWKNYAEYVRNTVPVKAKKEKTKMELLLEKMYNPDCAQLANESDIPAIRKLMIDTFDPVNSEILTENELRELIRGESVWLYKINEKICTLYIYRIEGKKRYGAMTYNCLSADYLYSVTRKANDISNKKHNPISHYGWIDLKNKKIRRTLEKQGSISFDGIKNYIYQKQ